MTPTSTDALIVVDIQNDFCPNGALAVADGDAIIPLVNQLMARFAQVVITQDFHPKGHISFASTHQKAPFSTITLPYGAQVLWPDHCIQGTFGAKLHKDLNTNLATLILRKGTRLHCDSYSGFIEADKITTTGLAGYLQENNVRRVFIAGLATDFCVAWTAMDAMKFDFKTYVITDACRGIDTDHSLEKAWQSMSNMGVQAITSANLLA